MNNITHANIDYKLARAHEFVDLALREHKRAN